MARRRVSGGGDGPGEQRVERDPADALGHRRDVLRRERTCLGLHRALFFNEHLGTLETFRPYAMPGDEWLETIAAAKGFPTLQ